MLINALEIQALRETLHNQAIHKAIEDIDAWRETQSVHLFLIPPPSLGSSPGLPRGPYIVPNVLHNLPIHCLLV
jgi:hypothetical protein